MLLGARYNLVVLGVALWSCVAYNNVESVEAICSIEVDII